MALFDSIRAGASAATESYQIERSLMFNDNDQTDLKRTPSSSGDRRTMTFSFWVKHNTAGYEPEDGEDHYFYNANFGSNNPQSYMAWKKNRLAVEFVTGGSYSGSVATERRFRDVGGWFHCVVWIDTTQSTSSNRVRFYINGVEETDRVGNNVSLQYPSQNFETAFGADCEQVIGEYFGGGGSHNYDGYIAEFHYVNGSTVAPTEFGEYDDNNSWVPIKYTGSYGTTGFYLKFTDDSNTTATTMGKDYSGNGNNWTPSNFNTHDISADTPTNNFCTMNINDKSDSTLITTEYGGRRVECRHGFRTIRGTFGVTSGKWYWEARLEDWSDSFIGITSVEEDIDGNTRGAETDQSAQIRQNNGDIRSNGNNSSYGNSQSNGDVLGFALDMDNGKFYISENGTFYNSGDPANQTNPAVTGLTKRICPACAPYDNKECYYNFGADDTFNGNETSQGNTDGNGIGKFRYAPPSGFLALCSQNLPEPTIPEGAKYFKAVSYTGNGSSSRDITGLDFQPDFVWIKSRDHNYIHQLYDAVRGAGKSMYSNHNFSEGVDVGLKAFNSDGFELGNLQNTNENGSEYVSWSWNAGGSTVTDSSGSISVNRRTNATAGFSIISYSGNNTSGATIAHGLGIAPKMLVVKSRDQNRGWNTLWDVGGSGAGPTKYVQWQQDHQPVDNSAWWNDTSPSSSVITLGNDNDVNDSSQNYICYAWAPVEGYQAIGRYVGNGSSQGTFINTGFRPAFLFIRRLDSTGNWILLDESRNASSSNGNGLEKRLLAESSNQESTAYVVAFLFSNGFQLQDMYDGSWNANGGNFAYLAIARHPYKFSNAR